jgi:HEAT repeat protein
MKIKGESRGIRGLGVIGVIADYSIARIAPETGVRRLVAAMSSLDEDTSMAAYMALVKLGPIYAQRVVREMKMGEETAGLIQLLGDLGDPSVISYLEEFTKSDDPALASAARESLDLLRLENP